MSLHHSDHDGVVRIFVGHLEIVKRLLDYLHYAAQFSLYQECNITRHNFLYTRSVIYYIGLYYAAQFFPYQECNKVGKLGTVISQTKLTDKWAASKCKFQQQFASNCSLCLEMP